MRAVEPFRPEPYDAGGTLASIRDGNVRAGAPLRPEPLPHVRELHERGSSSAVGSNLAPVVDLLDRGHIEELPAVFAVCERLHREGDAEVREAATIGFLEALQNIAANEGIDPDAFHRFLLPESRRWWEALNQFWAGRSSCVCVEGTAGD